MHSQSNLFKKVPGSHVRIAGNQFHAIPISYSTSEKDSDPKMTRFVLSEGLYALKRPKLGVPAGRASEQASFPSSFDKRYSSAHAMSDFGESRKVQPICAMQTLPRQKLSHLAKRIGGVTPLLDRACSSQRIRNILQGVASRS
jgi:hypothetical protein